MKSSKVSSTNNGVIVKYSKFFLPHKKKLTKMQKRNGKKRKRMASLRPKSRRPKNPSFLQIISLNMNCKRLSLIIQMITLHLSSMPKIFVEKREFTPEKRIPYS
jgi:hypothetical protein